MRHLAKIIVPLPFALVAMVLLNHAATSVGDAINNATAAHKAALDIPFND